MDVKSNEYMLRLHAEKVSLIGLTEFDGEHYREITQVSNPLSLNPRVYYRRFGEDGDEDFFDCDLSELGVREVKSVRVKGRLTSKTKIIIDSSR